MKSCHINADFCRIFLKILTDDKLLLEMEVGIAEFEQKSN